MEYLPFLSSKLTAPLVSDGNEGVPVVISDMEAYSLLREDWDGLVELAHFPGGREMAALIPSKVSRVILIFVKLCCTGSPWICL